MEMGTMVLVFPRLKVILIVTPVIFAWLRARELKKP